MSANPRYREGDIVTANGRTWEVLVPIPPDMYRLKSGAMEATIRTQFIKSASERAQAQYKRAEAERLARRH